MGLDSTYPELTTLKVVYNGLARRVKVPYDMEWNDFEHKVCRLFNISSPLVTSYKDSMGVSVIVDNSDDFFFFLDEEYTGRLDIVTNVEASEASDWTVVRTDTGKALKELDHSSEISLSDNISEKAKPESGIAHSESVSSTFSSCTHSLGPEKNPSITSGSPARATTPEVPQVAVQLDPIATAAEDSPPTKESPNYTPPTEDTQLANCSDSANKFIPDLRFSNSPVNINEVQTDAEAKIIDIPSTGLQVPEDQSRELQLEAEAKPLEASKEGSEVQISQPSRPSSVASKFDVTSLDDIHKQEAYEHDLDSVSLGHVYGENRSEKSSASYEKFSNSENNIDTDASKEQIEAASPIEADFQEFADALVSSLFNPGSSESAAITSHEQIHKNNSTLETFIEPDAIDQMAEQPQGSHEKEAPKLSGPTEEEHELLKKGQELRSLCFKFDEVFHRHPSLLTTIELFTDQITHGVPIDLKILETGLSRLAPLPEQDNHPKAVFEAASSLVGSVGNMINHFGSSIGSLIENDISKFLLQKPRACQHEQNNNNSQASQENDCFPGPSNEESLETRKCHRRSHRHGCKCHKKHRSGHNEKVEDSPVAEELYEERRHHRRHGHKRKSHNCPVHRLESTSSFEKSSPVSAPNPEVEKNASFTTAFDAIAICPPKLPEIGSHSKSQFVPSPPKEYSHFSFLNDANQNSANPLISLKGAPVEDSVERSRRPYSLKSLIMAPDVESFTPATYGEPIKPSQDLGQEINPADVALISGIVALRDMGFHDDAANLDALQAHFGRLEDAIEALLKL